MNHQILSVCALAFLWGTASAQPRCEVRHPDSAALAAAAERARSVSAMLTGSAEGSVAVVDVLVAYDRSGADYATRRSGGIDAFAEARIAAMNDCLPNTGLDAHLRFRLAGTVAIEETAWGLDSALCQLIDDYGTVVAQGEWKKITDARERLGADVVSVLINNGSPDSGMIGLGYSLDDLNVARGFADWAYSVCNIRAVEEDFTMLHEIGHNMGCGHPDASCASASAMSLGPQSTAYAAGFYTWSGGRGYYTIMGYNFGGLRNGVYNPSDRFEPLPCFSSPDFTYNGLQIGTAFNDNTRVLIATCAAVSRFRTAKVPEEAIVVDCPSIDDATLMVGVAGPDGGYAVTCNAEIKKVTAKGLPSGMKLVQDKTTNEWSIQGAPKKAQRGSFTLTVTTVSKKTASRSFDYEVLSLPSELSGTFNGFIFAGEAKVGSVSVTVKDGGKITAKVVTASKTTSFSTTGWGMVDEACIGTVGMVTKKGEELELQIDGAAAWNEGCVEGAFQTSDGEVFSVLAWRNAYAKNGKTPADPDAAAFLAEILSSNKGKYLFDAEEQDDGSWLFVRSESKKPAVTVTVDKKGMVKVKGKVDGINLSGTAQLLASEDGVGLAEFSLPVKSGKAKVIVDLSFELCPGGVPGEPAGTLRK